MKQNSNKGKKPKVIKSWTVEYGLHKHEWAIASIGWEYPIGMSGTAIAEQYAYLLCQCMEVRKSKVKARIEESDLTQPD